MKKILLSLLVSIMFFSCKEDTDPVHTLIGEWDLVSQTGSIAGQKRVGAEMSYQQTYEFRKDGTFTKIHKVDGQVLEARGKYSTTPVEAAASANERLNVALDFIEGEEIARDCYGPNVENLVLRKNDQLVNTWNQCDGSGLIYQKK